MRRDDVREDLWVPDNPDGSGWADVDWASATRGSRYRYEHGLPLADAERQRSSWYEVVTRSETEAIPTPHENTYYVAGSQLADFLAEMVWNGGSEVIWHVGPIDQPPEEAHVRD